MGHREQTFDEHSNFIRLENLSTKLKQRKKITLFIEKSTENNKARIAKHFLTFKVPCLFQIIFLSQPIKLTNTQTKKEKLSLLG